MNFHRVSLFGLILGFLSACDNNSSEYPSDLDDTLALMPNNDGTAAIIRTTSRTDVEAGLVEGSNIDALSARIAGLDFAAKRQDGADERSANASSTRICRWTEENEVYKARDAGNLSLHRYQQGFAIRGGSRGMPLTIRFYIGDVPERSRYGQTGEVATNYERAIFAQHDHEAMVRFHAMNGIPERPMTLEFIHTKSLSGGDLLP
jgi:hypothetical protein